MPSEWIIVAVVAVIVLFGGTQVPKIARSLGSAKNEFHKGQKEGEPPVPPTTTELPPRNQNDVQP